MNLKMESVSDEPILRLGTNPHGRNVILSCIVDSHFITVHVFLNSIELYIDYLNKMGFPKDNHQFVTDIYDNGQINILYIQEILKLCNIKGVL